MLNRLGGQLLTKEQSPVGCVDLPCKYCKKPISLSIGEFKRRSANKFGIFCSTYCTTEYRKAQPPKNPTHVEFNCHVCGTRAKTSFANYRTRSKNPKNKFFCGIECTKKHHKTTGKWAGRPSF